MNRPDEGFRQAHRLARRLTVQQLIEWGEPYETAEQIVAELAANAALHGRVPGRVPGRSFRLSLSLDSGLTGSTLRIAVSDPRPERLPELRAPQAVSGVEDESGRGLLIVVALADRWGVDLTVRPLKTVWAELDIRRG
ncbi:ATP-binding protein [Kitasatospora sp. GP82]|uniref:ATP-binding protein n=1 Tax=Kitasatospora sp. GP82 TaxID=3035089 RepID=UPI0024765A77|nr:ATP-binding protein [Kitasatospora sp. GP82]